MVEEAVITEATICFLKCKCNRHFHLEFRYQAQVFGVINGIEREILAYYDNELTFRSSEFIGLTQQEAVQLFHDKDVICLRS